MKKWHQKCLKLWSDKKCQPRELFVAIYFHKPEIILQPHLWIILMIRISLKIIFRSDLVSNYLLLKSCLACVRACARNIYLLGVIFYDGNVENYSPLKIFNSCNNFKAIFTKSRFCENPIIKYAVKYFHKWH